MAYVDRQAVSIYHGTDREGADTGVTGHPPRPVHIRPSPKIAIADIRLPGLVQQYRVTVYRVEGYG